MDAANLKVWLPFDTSATFAEDKLGNTWTAYGTVSIGTDNAKTGNALQLNKGYLRSDEAIEFGGADFTVSFYSFMGSSSNNWGGLFCAQSTTNTGNSNATGRINFYRNSSSNNLALQLVKSSNVTITNDETVVYNFLNSLHHFELDYSHADSMLKIFIDGQLTYTKTVAIERLARYIYLGCTGYDPDGQRMVGTIDEFLLYDGVALHSENFTPPNAEFYDELAFLLDSTVEFTVDVERRISNIVEVTFDVQRKVKQKWRYVNAGTADSLIVTGTTLSNLPESKSKTGTAFYQTTRAKCFDLSATDEIWLKFDVYFDGSNRWRAYNDNSNGANGVCSYTDNDFGMWQNSNRVQDFSDICKTNQLQTVLLHMISGSSAGVIEAWVDGEKIYTYTGDVNHGEDFADIYLQSDGAGTFFSNVIISNSEIKFGEGYQIFYFDVERRTSKHSEYFFDVARCVVNSIVIPLIDDHFNHLVPVYLDIYNKPRKFILPKKSKVCVRGVGGTTFRIFSDTDHVGKIVGSGYREFGKFYAELDECENIFIEIAQQTTPQQVIHAFMYALASRNATLDEAIDFATSGKFQTAAAVASQFLADLNSSASYTDFLKDYCDIILGNEDTGAITGLDAGGAGLKTNFSIVPEKTSVENWITPSAGSTTTINGLTVHWPTRGASGKLTDAEKFILAGLNSEWIARSLELILESYELDFNIHGVYEVYLTYSPRINAGDSVINNQSFQ